VAAFGRNRSNSAKNRAGRNKKPAMDFISNIQNPEINGMEILAE